MWSQAVLDTSKCPLESSRDGHVGDDTSLEVDGFHQPLGSPTADRGPLGTPS